MASKIVGGCMCGAVRYESTAEAVMQANCYCRDCQRSTGGAFAPVVLVPKEAFKLTKGRLKHYEVSADSGNKVSRGFCADCGSPIISLLAGMPFTACPTTGVCSRLRVAQSLLRCARAVSSPTAETSVRPAHASIPSEGRIA